MAAGIPEGSEGDTSIDSGFMEVISRLYEVAGQLRSRVSMLVRAWVIALLISIIVPFALFVSAARTARGVALGQASPSDLAVRAVDAIIVSTVLSLLLGVAIYYFMVRFMAAGVEFSRTLAWASILARSGPTLGVEEAERRARPGEGIMWSYEGYYTVFKITVALAFLVATVLAALRSTLIGRVESMVTGNLPQGGAIDLWQVVSPALSLMIIVGILSMALMFLRIFYGKPFFDALNREIRRYGSTGLYYALLEILTLVSVFVRDLIVDILALGALVFFLMDINSLAGDAERHVGKIRAELRKAFGAKT